MKADHTGTCSICGIVGKLSFEHVPPRAAFNDHRVFEADVFKIFEGDYEPGQRPTDGTWKQRGAGRYSLCGKCNNDTGTWYGESYVQVAKQAAFLLYRSNGTVSLAYPYGMFPLRFLKQIVTMFFSACGPGFQGKNADLVRFVLNRHIRYLPHDIRFFVYLHHPDSFAIRQSGLTGVIKSNSNPHVFAEIAFPPFGLVMTVAGAPAPDHRMCEITHLNQYTFQAWDVVYLKLPALQVSTVLPGDFRTIDEVKRDVNENRKLGSMFLDPPSTFPS